MSNVDQETTIEDTIRSAEDFVRIAKSLAAIGERPEDAAQREDRRTAYLYAAEKLVKNILACEEEAMAFPLMVIRAAVEQLERVY